MTGEHVWGIARTILAAVGGYFAGKGYIDGDTVNAIVGGLGTVFIAVWSFLAKKKA